MNLESIKANKTGMILKFSVPSIIAMVLTSLITITDGFFTGNYIGEDAIAAINMGLPIVYLYLGLGLMLSVGGSVIAGMLLGAGEKEKANSIFNQTIQTTVILSFAVSIFFFLLFTPLMNLFHVNGKMAEFFRDYYSIMLLELPIMIINNSLGMFIRGEGNPRFFMKISIFNVLSNIILDYVFVAPLQMGITGIAVASLLSAVLCLLWILYYFFRKSVVYRFGRFSFDKGVFRRTVLNGSSEFIGEISMSITMFAYNYVILKSIGVDGVTAFTIVGYVAYIFSMILTGFGQGASPLISFAHGAKEKELECDIRKLTNRFVLIVGIIVILGMLLSSDWYSKTFVKSEIVQGMISHGIKIFVFSFLFSGINTISSFYFTSIGKAKESAVISSLRGLVVLLICIFILPKLFGMTGVWLVALITEAVTFLVSMYYIYRNDRLGFSTKETAKSQENTENNRKRN